MKLNTRIWYYHVDSDSNPSDGLSRDGVKDEWSIKAAASLGWRLMELPVPKIKHLATLPFELLTRGLIAVMNDDG